MIHDGVSRCLTFSILFQQLRYLLQAVMKFHGVGNPSKTPAEATALEMGRGRQSNSIAADIASEVIPVSHDYRI